MRIRIRNTALLMFRIIFYTINGWLQGGGEGPWRRCPQDISSGSHQGNTHNKTLLSPNELLLNYTNSRISCFFIFSFGKILLYFCRSQLFRMDLGRTVVKNYLTYTSRPLSVGLFLTEFFIVVNFLQNVFIMPCSFYCSDIFFFLFSPKVLEIDHIGTKFRRRWCSIPVPYSDMLLRLPTWHALLYGTVPLSFHPFIKSQC